MKLAEALPEAARPDFVTLSRDGAGRYFVSFAVQVDLAPLARGFHARAIHDAPFSEFRRPLDYKARWHGRTVIAVDRFFPSTQRCSGCSHVCNAMRLDVRTWTCPHCGCEHDRA